jgi:hypothetical protein
MCQLPIYKMCSLGNYGRTNCETDVRGLTSKTSSRFCCGCVNIHYNLNFQKKISKAQSDFIQK